MNEVQGFVMDQEGKVVHRLFGKWHEGLFCGVPPSAKCIWRPGILKQMHFILLCKMYVLLDLIFVLCR